MWTLWKTKKAFQRIQIVFKNELKLCDRDVSDAWTKTENTDTIGNLILSPTWRKWTKTKYQTNTSCAKRQQKTGSSDK